MRRILVTGASGLLGYHVSKRLLQEVDVEIYGTCRHSGVPPGVVSVQLDLTGDHNLAHLPPRVDTVIHCAALIPDAFTDYDQADRLWCVNALGTLRLLEWTREGGATRFIYCSSHPVYSQPVPYPIPEKHGAYPGSQATPYSVSKLSGEIFATALNSPDFAVSSLRFPTIFGKEMRHGGVLGHFIARARRGDSFRITANPASLFDFLYVKDAVTALVAAAAAPLPAPIYNVGSGTGATLPAVARAAWSAFGPDAEPEIVIDTGGRPARHAVLDIARAQADFAYQPAYTVMSALAEMEAEGHQA